jgi:hypothetical protein
VVSSRLSALQHDFVDAFFSEPSAFFLTGGAALAGYHLGHRFTDDLDPFSPPAESIAAGVMAPTVCPQGGVDYSPAGGAGAHGPVLCHSS